MIRGLALIIALLAMPLPAAAHKVIFSIFKSGDVVEGELGFSNGDMSSGAVIEAFDSAGNKIGEAITDADGFFVYAPTQAITHIFKADMGAGHVAEAEMSTPYIERAYIEPEAGYATYENGKVVIHACTQAPVMDREAMEVILGWEADRIRIVPTAIGGGFGSKLDVSVQPFLALGAIKTGKPVRMTYSRVETMQSTTKRHPSDIALKIGATTSEVNEVRYALTNTVQLVDGVTWWQFKRLPLAD